MATVTKAPGNASAGLADTVVDDAPSAPPAGSPGGDATGADPASFEVVPGADVLGRGIYIRPLQPYELRDYLFTPQQEGARLRMVSNYKRPYLVPPGCEVNDSPPLPADRATGQTIIEESWDRFGREVTTNIQAAANAKILSIDATSFQGHSLKLEEDSYYALRSTFIPFWSVYMPRVDRKRLVAEFTRLEGGRDGADHADDLSMPEGPFDPLRRADYARIFDRFGTHYVKCVWLGGKASLTFVVTKSSNLSKEDLKAGIEATFAGGVGSGGASTSRSSAQERVRNNSTCSVFGSGGDATELAKLTTLMPEQYDRWIDSVKDNPEAIELGVSGIWTLLDDPVKSEALRQAYREESTFKPLNVLVPYYDWVVILKDDQAFDYALTAKYGPSRLCILSCLFKPGEILKPVALRDWLADAAEPQMYARFMQSAAQDLPSLRGAIELTDADSQAMTQADLSAKLASALNDVLVSGQSVMDMPLFKTALEKIPQQSWRPLTQDMAAKASTHGVMLNRLLLEEIFPTELAPRPPTLSLATYLPVLEGYSDFVQPHAAFSLYGFGPEKTTKLYLIRWRKCLRIDLQNNTIDKGYPKDIAEEWPGVRFDRIDAAVAFAPSRLYFFRGAEYIRYDFDGTAFVWYTQDLIKTRWPGVVFDNIDTAAYWGSNKIYFFSGDQYIRYDFAAHRADPGYPKFLSSNYVDDWEIFE